MRQIIHTNMSTTKISREDTIPSDRSSFRCQEYFLVHSHFTLHMFFRTFIVIICQLTWHAAASNLLGWEPFYLKATETDDNRFTEQNSVDNDATPLRDVGHINPPAPPLDVVPLLVTGSSANRVDFVFFSDGYIEEERSKFIQDALRLAKDVSSNHTFNTVQPLLNFWAAFTPSIESGIGVNGTAKNTPYGLYRDGTELRGVYYKHPKVGRAACDSLGNQCDYPILLGNDPLYGGLGGDFTVITASILNGPLVLRHELGHSILKVGEEYDGGFGYFGRNAAHDIHELPWKQWLSDPSRVDANGEPHVERSVMTLQAYPWTLLNTSTPWAVDFSSSGTYTRYSLQFSLSGLPQQQDLRVTLDGVDLKWTPRSNVGMDRWFYNYLIPESLTPGQHRLEFTLLNESKEGVAQLCSIEVLEYGTEDEFVSEKGFYGIYPTFSDTNKTSYRPTNDDCLMRLVTTPDLCKVCRETLWLHLLRTVSFIDNIHESCERVDGLVAKVLTVDLLPLANFRKSPISNLVESYAILWSKDDQLIPEFTNKTRIALPAGNPTGEYVIQVRYSTEEVRLASPMLQVEESYKVEAECGGLAV